MQSDSASMQTGQTDQRRAWDHLNPHRSVHLEHWDGSLAASLTAVGHAALLVAPRNTPHAVGFGDDQTVTGRCLEVLAIECDRLLQVLCRRASIANVVYRTPGLHSQSQPRMHSSVGRRKGNLPS